MGPDLILRLEALARAPHLLVGCDYDGTIAEIVLDPAQALPDAMVLDGLRALSRVRNTTTAVVSGRSLTDLNALLGIGDPAIRIGSHGAEWESPGVALTAPQRDLLRQLAGAVSSLVDESRGLHCEIKPAGVALHVRGARRRIADMTIAAAIASFGRLPGVFVRRGSEVVEFMVVPANKGDAVLRLKRGIGATAVLFIGDDLTDEDVFKVLTSDDDGLRVGEGISHARHRVASVEEVGAVLKEVAKLRSACVESRSFV